MSPIGRHLKASSYQSAAQTEDAAELDKKIQKLKNQDLEIRIGDQSDHSHSSLHLATGVRMGNTKHWGLIRHEDGAESRSGLPLTQDMMSPLHCELNLTDTSVQQMKASYLSQQSPVSYTVVEPDHQVRAFALDNEVAESSMQEHEAPAVEVIE